MLATQNHDSPPRRVLPSAVRAPTCLGRGQIWFLQPPVQIIIRSWPSKGWKLRISWSLSPKQLTGALAQAPPVAAISMAGGGVARAAPATPRLESNVLHPRFAWKHVVVSNLSLLAEHQMLIFKSARLTEVVVAPSGSPLHSEPDRLSVRSDPADGTLYLHLRMGHFSLSLGKEDIRSNNLFVSLFHCFKSFSCLCRYLWPLSSVIVSTFLSFLVSVSVSVSLVSVDGVFGVSSVVVVWIERSGDNPQIRNTADLAPTDLTTPTPPGSHLEPMDLTSTDLASSTNRSENATFSFWLSDSQWSVISFSIQNEHNVWTLMSDGFIESQVGV